MTWARLQSCYITVKCHRLKMAQGKGGPGQMTTHQTTYLMKRARLLTLLFQNSDVDEIEVDEKGPLNSSQETPQGTKTSDWQREGN
jgi:hypothetical protein